MNKSTLYSLLFMGSLIVYQSCSIDDDIIVCYCPPELITTVNVTLTNLADTLTLTFADPDGEGGDDPVITGGTLDPNTTYNYVATFFNESETPAEDITEEVQEENLEHFVSISGVDLDVDVAITDMDDDGNPLGLAGTVTTKDADSGSLRVLLLHEPTKTSTGATGGSTDVDVSFPVSVE